MKRLQFLFFLFALLLTLPFTITAQQLAQNYNLRQKSSFTENKGQVADQNSIERNDVKYLYSAPGLKLVLKNNSFSYEVFTLEKKKKDKAFSEVSGESALAFSPPYEGGARGGFKEPDEVTVKTHRIDVSFVGANPNPELIAEERSDNYNNYYLAHTPEEGVTNVYSYSKLTYKNLYPNIDIVFYAKEEGKLKYDIVVHPGGKLEDVRMNYDGADGLALMEGKLEMKTALGEIKEEIPYSFIKENNQEVQVQHVLKNNIVSFDGNYDKSRTLVIDPILEWGTYYGGNSFDAGFGLEKDSVGNIYLVGQTLSTNNIATTGTHQSTINGAIGSSFVVKFTSGGVRQWGTYYEGSLARGISLDKQRNIYIVGNTTVTTGIATTGAHQVTFGGNRDAFLIKFNNNGIRQWGTYYGGSGEEFCDGIVTDRNNNIYITGPTTSSTTIAIATSGSHQTTYGGGRDAFIAKFNSSGVRQWGTYYGGSGEEWGYGISADTTGNIYITGETQSTSGISSVGAHQSTSGGYVDAYIVKFNTNGVRQWGTYYGGTGAEDTYDIYADHKGFIYVLGNSTSSSGIATLGAHQTVLANQFNADAYIVKFNTNGVRQWGTYYGGDKQDGGYAVSVNKNGDVYITGYTQSITGIASSCVYQSSFSGVDDAFVAKFTSSGKREWGTYYGGTDFERSRGIVVDESGNVYITGETRSSSGITTTNSHQSTFGGGTADAFFAKFTDQVAFLDGEQTVCSSNIYSYTSNKGTGFSYNWSITGGTIITGQGTEKIDVLWGSAGTGSVKVVVTYYSVCKDSATRSVTIQASPIADAGANSTICSGSSIQIGSSAVAGNTYSWTSNPKGFTSILSNPHVSPSDTTIYYLTVKDTLTGCTSTDSVIISVNPPIADNNIGTSQTICAGSVPLTISGSTPSGGGGTYFYQWESSTDSNIWILLFNATNITYSPPSLNQTTWYRRSVSTSTCTGTLASMSNTVKITVNPLPVADFTATRECIGKTTSFTNSSILASSFTWIFGDGDSAFVNKLSHTYKSAGTYQVTLIARSANGCTDTITKDITVDPLPVSAFSTHNTCLGDSTRFTSSSTGAATYLWNFGDGNNSSLENPSHIYATAGTFTVKLKVWNGAGCTDSATNTVTVHPLPLAAISVVKDTTADRTYTFSSANNAAAYLWRFGDGRSDTGKTVKHTYKNDSTYKVVLTVTDTNACVAFADTSITVFTVGINEIFSPAFDLKLYPNPFSCTTTLEYNLQQRANTEISIYDLTGKEIAVLQKGMQPEGIHFITIDAGKYQLKAGIYILKILAGNQIISRQLIKLKE